MTLHAYQSMAAARDAAIARLRAHAEAKELAPGPLAWNGAKGSLVGCILESEDLAQWEHELGLPQWLATTVDGLAAQQATVDDALAFGVELLSAIRPGADVSLAGSVVIVSVLDDADDFVARLAEVPAELQQAATAVRALHRRLLEGERPAPTEWRAARRSATALTDAQSSELLKSLATCVETAAWDPLTSKSVVFDTLRVYGRAAVHKADAESGFTAEDDAEIRAHLDLMWKTHLADKPELQEQGITVFALLAQHYPAIDEKLRRKIRHDRETVVQANRRAADVLIAQLKQA